MLRKTSKQEPEPQVRQDTSAGPPPAAAAAPAPQPAQSGPLDDRIVCTGGEGTKYDNVAGTRKTIFDMVELHTPFTYILPFIEQADVFAMMNLNYTYRDTRWPGNQAAACTEISTYACPSNPYLSVQDTSFVGVYPTGGYGRIDYYATVYTDIDPDPSSATYGMRNENGTRMDGALCVPSTPIAAIRDGTSNTIAIIEDAGRTAPASAAAFASYSKYTDPTVALGGTIAPADQALTDTNNPNTANPAPYRAMWRWADQDACGSGISGPPNVSGKFINQNATPIGGPPTGGGCPTLNVGGQGCPWNCNNCGPNDEPFSFHPGGCNAVLCDGSVKFLSDTINGVTLRFSVTRAEGVPPGSY
jgi:prepilin-type processing-associated H-X9-DG protein